MVACPQDIAERTAKSLSGAGVFGVEMFLMADDAFKYRFHSQEIRQQCHLTGLKGQILLNEIVARRHNMKVVISAQLSPSLSAAVLNLLGSSDDMSVVARSHRHNCELGHRAPRTSLRPSPAPPGLKRKLWRLLY